MPKLIKKGERQIQEAIIEWARWHEKKWPGLKWLYSNRNEASSIGERVKGDKMGIKKGVFDLFLPVKAPHPHAYPGQPRRFFSGLYIELKYGKNQLRAEQDEFGRFIASQGFKGVVAWSCEEATDYIEEYLLEVK